MDTRNGMKRSCTHTGTHTDTEMRAHKTHVLNGSMWPKAFHNGDTIKSFFPLPYMAYENRELLCERIFNTSKCAKVFVIVTMIVWMFQALLAYQREILYRSRILCFSSPHEHTEQRFQKALVAGCCIASHSQQIPYTPIGLTNSIYIYIYMCTHEKHQHHYSEKHQCIRFEQCAPFFNTVQA